MITPRCVHRRTKIENCQGCPPVVQCNLLRKDSKKRGKSFYGYKNHINTDAKFKLIRARHDSQVLDDMVKTSAANTSSDLYADTAPRKQSVIHTVHEVAAPRREVRSFRRNGMESRNEVFRRIGLRWQTHRGCINLEFQRTRLCHPVRSC